MSFENKLIVSFEDIYVAVRCRFWHPERKFPGYLACSGFLNIKYHLVV